MNLNLTPITQAQSQTFFPFPLLSLFLLFPKSPTASNPKIRRKRRKSTQLYQPPAHFSTHLSSSMDPTLKRQNKPTSGNPISGRNPPQKPFYLSNPLSKLTHKTKKPPPTVDTQLQAKSLTLSADFDGLKLSSLKPKQHQQLKRVEPRLEKEVKVKKEEKKKEVKDVVDVKRMNVSIEGIGRRRSFCGSQVELGDFLANNGAKIVAVDMPPFMQIHAVDCARKTHDSLEKFTSKTLALTLKKEFDGVYGPAWHCIVGTSFGSFVTHSVGGFLYFSIDQKLYVLLFKTTVQRAD